MSSSHVRRRGLRGGLQLVLVEAEGLDEQAPDLPFVGRGEPEQRSTSGVAAMRQEAPGGSVRRTPPASAARQIGDDASRGSGPADVLKRRRRTLSHWSDRWMSKSSRPRSPSTRSIEFGGTLGLQPHGSGNIQAVERSLLRGDVEGREERGRAVALVVVAAAGSACPGALCRRRGAGNGPGPGSFPALLRRHREPGQADPAAATTTSATARPVSSRTSTSPRRRDRSTA